MESKTLEELLNELVQLYKDWYDYIQPAMLLGNPDNTHYKLETKFGTVYFGKAYKRTGEDDSTDYVRINNLTINLTYRPVIHASIDQLNINYISNMVTRFRDILAEQPPIMNHILNH